MLRSNSPGADQRRAGTTSRTMSLPRSTLSRQSKPSALIAPPVLRMVASLPSGVITPARTFGDSFDNVATSRWS